MRLAALRAGARALRRHQVIVGVRVVTTQRPRLPRTLRPADGSRPPAGARGGRTLLRAAAARTDADEPVTEALPERVVGAGAAATTRRRR